MYDLLKNKFNYKVFIVFLFLLLIVMPIGAIGTDEFSADDPQTVSTESVPAEIITTDSQLEPVLFVDDAVPVSEEIAPVVEASPADEQLGPILDFALPNDSEEIISTDSVTPEEITTDSITDVLTEPTVDPATLPSIAVNEPTVSLEVDPNAQHSCELANFSIDLTGLSLLENNILLIGKKISNGQLQVTGLPEGVTVKFPDSQSSTLNTGIQDNYPVQINKTVDAQKGNFNVIFFYTDLDHSSSTVCQMNVINN